MESFDVVIAGGGIVGLACAYHLARAGARVAVAEREAPGAGASVAAAGMLAAQHEPQGDGPLYRLCLGSRDAWPALAADLLAETGMDVELVRSGILSLAATPAEAEHLQATAAWQEASGQATRWWPAAVVAQHLPGAAPTCGGLLAPADMQLRADRAVQALHQACRRRGVAVRCGVEVTGFRTSGHRVEGVETSAGPLAATTTVLAAGAWAGALASRLGVRLPVFPVRGQVLTLLPDHGAAGPWTAALTPVFGPGCYLVPRRDGHLLVGATMEPDAGFDRRVTLGAIARLGQAAAALLPALARAPLGPAWSGLRPGTPDGLPYLGPLPDWQGIVAATGHLRNGILLAPATGAAVAALCAGRPPAVDLAPFAPGRAQ